VYRSATDNIRLIIASTATSAHGAGGNPFKDEAISSDADVIICAL